jgi:formylglycine-generating enzyme required for sulfatase activity
LNWRDNSSDELGFIISRKTGTAEWTETDTVAADSNTIIVTGLTPESDYYFRVRAFNGAAISRPADSVAVTTSKLGYTNGFQFVKIPAGSFNMGSDSGKIYEKPVHLVTIAYDFWMMETEVTQKQWIAVMGSNPSFWKGDSLPVESVTWQNCQTFIDSLNHLYPGKGYRFPTEAEWEYAARAGTDTFFPTGNDTVACGRAGWYKGNSGSRTHPGRLREANAFGLYDMIGNVAEWIADWWHDDYNGAPNDGSEWKVPAGTFPVKRGGASMTDINGCRAQNRPPNPTGGQAAANGLRLVVDTPEN